MLWARTAAAGDAPPLRWNDDWPRVRPWELVDAAVLTVADTLVETQIPVPAQARWRGGILFDDWARQVFRGRTAQVQSAASTISDWLYKGGTLAPFIVDVYLVSLSIHQNLDVAFQMLVMDLQSLSFAGLVSLGAEHGVGRQRPFVSSCGPDGTERDAAGRLLHVCDPADDNRSFFSGHVASVATMAGLTCLHHQYLPLYGGGLADLAPCLFMVGLAGGTGVLRLVYDEHWASDVIVGWGVGWLAGYLLPSMLHYGSAAHGASRTTDALRLQVTPTVRPVAGGGAEFGLTGVF